MEALQLLTQRSSYAKLSSPAPSGEKLQNILAAGVRAPDHANLQPYEFVVIQDKGLERLTDIFVRATKATTTDEFAIEKAAKMAYRAPMIIVGLTRYKPHEKVPHVEQIATTACALQNMQMAAIAQGFNGIWRTGTLAKNHVVKEAFCCAPQDEIVGFLYLGTPESEVPIKRAKDTTSCVQFWD